MTTAALEVITSDQSSRIQRIKDLHAAVADNAKVSVKSAMLCGFELTVLKAITPHGQFLSLCETQFPELHKRTGRNYMALLEVARSKKETVSLLLTEAIAAPQKQLPAPKEEILLDAFHDFADGGTITDLYRAAGVIRPPQKQKHHPIKLTPEDRLQADLKHAADLFHDTRIAIDLLFEDESIFAKVPSVDRLELLGSALRLTKKLRTFKQTRSRGRQSAPTKNREAK